MLALEGHITLYESPNLPRRRADDGVTLIVMELDAEGSGTGQIAIGARVAVDEDGDGYREFIVEKHGNAPVRLKNISTQ